MAKITTNQQSYRSVACLLSVEATATRTGDGKVSITADWTIVVGSNTSLNAKRYLVLYVPYTDSNNKTAYRYYYSTSLRSSWDSSETYTGAYTFNNVVLDSAATSIEIGFGVSNTNTAPGEDDKGLIWNGRDNTAGGKYSSAIQYNSITGIAAWYTACKAPTNVTLSPDVFVDSVTITWDGAEGGTNNELSGYDVQVRRSTAAGEWNTWGNSSIVQSGHVWNPSTVEFGGAIQYRVRAKGTAGGSYYSAWKESNIINKVNPAVHIYNDNAASFAAYSYESYFAYIHNGADFERYIPYIYDGEAWQLYA